jgi:DNA-binding MarR family transcriptional regulator
MQNIIDTRNDSAATDASPEPPPSVDRPALVRELLDEMTSWSPRDRGGVFKNWHRDALSLVHLNVLSALEAEGALSMRRLAEAMDVSDASATGIVDRMEKRGLVQRRHDTDDRRVVLVYPTEAGGQVFVNIAAHRREGLARILTELTAEEIAGLLVGMRAIHAARKRVFGADLPDAAPSDAVTPAPSAAMPDETPEPGHEDRPPALTLTGRHGR